MQRPAVSPSRRLRAGFELLVFLSLLELLLWTGAGAYPAALRGAAALGILAVVGMGLWRGPPQNMFRPHRSSQATAWLQAGGMTAAAVLILIAAGRLMRWWVGSLHLDFPDLTAWGLTLWFAGKLVVVGGQQLSLQLFLLPRILELTGRRSASLVLTSAVFGMVHLPNLLLAALTAVVAPLWCAFYLRTRRVMPLILSHLILAVAARATCGDAIYNLRVGAAVLPMLPRTVVAADGSGLQVIPGAIEGFLDHCTTEGETAVCVGWAADIDRREPAVEIVLLAAGGLHRFPATRQSRPDVAAEFQRPEIEDCGFRVELPASWLAAPEGVRFFATSIGGFSTELAYRWPAAPAP